MKKQILSCLFIMQALFLAAQEDASVKLDLLKAPSSPASNLLGIATTDIDKPTDVSAFMLSLQSATNSFSKLPSNYAVDIAPYFLFKKAGDVTTTGLQNNKNYKDVFRQTFVLSIAVRNPDSADVSLNRSSTYAGLGFKFSIFRGDYDDNTKNKLNMIGLYQDTILHHLQEAARKWKTNNDPEVIALRIKMQEMAAGKTTPEQLTALLKDSVYVSLQRQLSSKLAAFVEKDKDDVMSVIEARIRKIASSFQTNRIGWTWDVNGGISSEFRSKRFNNSKVHNAGLWTNFGYTGKKGSSFLGLVRYLYNPDQIFAKDNAPNDIANISTLDAGFRYAFSAPQSKFSCSMEGVYRSVLSSETIDQSWRIIFNADYAIWQNQKLTFSFGRNFDGTISKDGNLIAALTFLSGFGNKR
jgi:hypothetical protein